MKDLSRQPWIVLLIVAFGCVLATGARADWDEDEALALALRRRGLNDLLLALRRDQMKQDLPPARKVKVARRILDTMLRKANAAAKLEEKKRWLEQALAFWRRHKSIARSADERLDFDLLHADLVQTYGKFYLDQWRLFPEQEQWRAKAEESFAQALDQYRGLIDKLEERLARLEDTLGDSTARSRLWQEAQADVARTQYNIAWTSYRLGLVQKSQEKKKALLLQAIEEFKPFTETFRAHPVVIDCLIGQALASSELGQFREALEFLKPVTEQNAQPAQWRQVVFLRLEALVGLKRYLDAHAMASRHAADLPEKGEQLQWFDRKVLLKWVEALTLLARHASDPGRQEQYRKQAGDVATRLYALGEPWRTQVLRLLKGKAEAIQESPLQRYLRVKSDFEQGRYQSAWEGAQALIEKPDEKFDEATRARILFYGAASGYNIGQAKEAAELFERIVQKYPKDPLAPKAAVLAVKALRTVLSSEPKREHYKRMVTLMNTVERRWPKAEDAANFPLYRAKALADLGALKDARAVLLQIGKDSPLYWPGRAIMAYVSLRADADGGAVPPERVWQDIHGFYEHVKMDSGLGLELASVAARAHIGYVWALMDAAPKEPLKVVEVLRDFEDMSRVHERMAAEARALRAAAFLKAGDVRKALGQLAAVETPLRVPSASAANSYLRLIQAALAVEPANGEQEKMLHRGTVTILSGLDDFHAATGQEGTPTGVSVKLLLGERLLELGENQRALTVLVEAVKAATDAQEMRARRAVGLAQVRAERYKQALPNWRAVLRQLDAGTEAWWEARYYLLVSLAGAGEKEQAAKIYRQIKILHPGLGGAAWQEKFAALERELDVREHGGEE